MPAPRPTSDAASWLLIGTMLATLAATQLGDPFTLDWPRTLLPGLGLTLLSVAAIAGGRAARPRLKAASIAFLQMTLFTVLGVLLAYAIAAHGGALWDTRFAAADRALGLDWPAVRALVDRSAPAVWLLALAYHSLILQMIVVIVALADARRFDDLRVTVCAAIIGGFATVLWSGITPAMGNLFDAAQYRNLWPSVASQHAAVIDALRSGALRRLDPSAMMGIVSFPSFHATLAAIFVWAYRRLPRLALAGGVWAALTILATPIGGGHYAVDVVAGLLLAPITLLAAKRLVSWTPFSRPRPAAVPAEPEPRFAQGRVIRFPEPRLRRPPADLWRTRGAVRRSRRW